MMLSACGVLKKDEILDAEALYKIEDISLKMEFPITNNGFIVGIPDFYFYWRPFASLWSDSQGYAPILFGYVEVKPTIRSVGEVMRQLQIYRTYSDKNAVLVLVTKTPDYKEVFESQGFHYFVFGKGQQKLKEWVISNDQNNSSKKPKGGV
ncbi:hypothetical protein DRZ78_02035 [Candidatus Aerophobetes bacterium]|uniref:Uncharacterized protein n=1 Tax=Aerophobetes bacterium TaxID=2030807 RepID=A0A662D4X9_UNCAE|nr:MAG: hypothetical protein DRZ78_02035 [Candidatus Aerophobetes bacterium]